MPRLSWITALAALVTLGAACGCSGGDTPDPTSADQQKAASQPDANTAPGQAAESQEKAF